MHLGLKRNFQVMPGAEWMELLLCATFRTTPGGNGHAPVSESADAASCAVVFKTLDSLMDAQDPVRLIKIDMEGHEYPALRGAEQAIGGHRPVVLFEQLASEFKGGCSPVIELLRSYGCRRFATVTGRTVSVRSLR